jgi:hypothetical protein
MTDERLALIVRSAFRGMLEAVLESGEAGQSHREPASPLGFAQEASRPAQAVPDEIPFPSVSRIEEDIMGETPPPTMGSLSEDMKAAAQERKREIDEAVAEMTRIRQRQERNAAPEVQGGPGEKEVAEWLRLPQQ